MTVSRLQSQVKQLTAHGRKLSSDDVKKLVATAKDAGQVDAKELAFLKALPADSFAAGARDDLTSLIGGVQAEAFVDVTAPAQTEVGASTKTGAKGVTLRFEDGLGQLTQNSFWLEGKATAAGSVEVDVDGKAIKVSTKAGDTSAAIAARLAKALPKGYQANVNSNFPDGRTAVQIFKMDALPASLTQPVTSGQQKPVKVLITGYGKFGPYATDNANPAWQLAQKVAKEKFPGADVQAVLLPVDWQKVDAFAENVKDTYHPDVIINLGAGPHGLEVWAQNATDGEDATGANHTGPVDAKGPDFELSTLPIANIEAAEQRIEDPSKGGTLGLHAPQTGTQDERLDAAKQFQIDAQNTYLCNYLNYRMLQTTQGSGIMSGFIHVDDTTSPQELEVVVQQSVKAQLEARQKSTPVA